MEGNLNNRSFWLAITALVAFIACIGGCVALGFAVRFGPGIYTFVEEQNSFKVGASAPDFSLRSLDGQNVQLSQFKGQPVLLTFATSWCPACRSEAPTLQSAHQQYPALRVLLVDSNESDSTIRNFASDFGMTHAVLLDTNGKVSNQYHIYAIPTSFFIDPEGVIRGVIIDAVTPNLIAKNLPPIGIQP